MMVKDTVCTLGSSRPGHTAVADTHTLDAVRMANGKTTADCTTPVLYYQGDILHIQVQEQAFQVITVVPVLCNG